MNQKGLTRGPLGLTRGPLGLTRGPLGLTRGPLRTATSVEIDLPQLVRRDENLIGFHIQRRVGAS